jgi:sacsin
MLSLLLKIGCVFLRQDLSVDHPQLKNYVQLPTAIGLVNAFLAVAGRPENIEGLFDNATEGEMHELRSFILQSKWFIEEKMEDKHINIIKHIPMFESYKSRKFVSLSNPVKLLKPSDIQEDFLSDDFVRTESEKEKIILSRYLEIEEPSRMEFYRDHVLNRMSKFLSEQGSLSAILHGVQLLVEEDNSLRSAISEIPFVLAADGSWQKPSRYNFSCPLFFIFYFL